MLCSSAVFFLLHSSVSALRLNSNTEIKRKDAASDPPISQADPDYYFHHVQKSGGSTLRRFFDQVCKSLNKESAACVRTREGASITDSQADELFGPESKFTASVISLREPVARTQSLINAWLQRCTVHKFRNMSDQSQAWCDQKGTVDWQIANGSQCFSVLASTGLDKNVPAMLHCFDNIYIKSLIGTDTRDPTHTTSLWENDNSFMKDLIGSKMGTPTHTTSLWKGDVPIAIWKDNTLKDLEMAKKRLQKFNGVVITEWLSRPEMQAYLSKHVLHLNVTIPTREARKDWRDASNATEINSTKLVYSRFTPQQREQVAMRNDLDIMLYNYAKKIVFERMRDAGFRLPATLLEDAGKQQ